MYQLLDWLQAFSPQEQKQTGPAVLVQVPAWVTESAPPEPLGNVAGSPVTGLASLRNAFF